MLIAIVALFLNVASANDYCKFCENEVHTMCQFKDGPADSCINYVKLTLSPSEKRYILDIHNDIRNHVASGQESRGALGNQPAAADMFILDWDDELAEIAQRWADQCISVNDSIQQDICKRTERFDVGQNIVTAITNNGELPELSLLVLNWYKQIVHVIPSDVDNFTGVWRGKYFIGQYTQLVWAKTKFVGCASAAFKEAADDLQYNIRLVCNYGPAGNIIGQPIYERGKPCSRCPQKLCDKLRPNLCSGNKKAVEVEKQKNILYKKLRDKTTTMSNISGNKKKMSQFSDPVSFRSTKVLQPQVTNSYPFDNSLNSEKSFYLTSEVAISLLNTTESSGLQNITEYKAAINISDRSQDVADNPVTYTPKNHTIDYVNGFTGISSSVSISDDENLQNITHFLFNTSLSPNLSYPNNFMYKIGLASNIILLIDNFLYKNSIIDSKIHATDGKSIIDLTKDECEKKIKLDKGLIVIQDCKNDSKQVQLPGWKYHYNIPRRHDKITVNGDIIILPGNRHFRRSTGIWHYGHCRCIRYHHSASTSLNAINFFSLIYLLVHIVVI